MCGGEFSHAALVALIAGPIGIHRAWGVNPVYLAQGGLLHDIDELYITPDHLMLETQILATRINAGRRTST